MVFLIRQKTMDFILKQWKHFTADWHILLERPVSAKKLSFVANQTSLPSFGFYFMLTLSTVIATLGLLSNSAATIIGAMIVAPLMGPIVSSSYSIITANYKLLCRSALTIMTGASLVVLIAMLTAHAIGLRVVGAEILARTNPTLLDLGVAVAAGAAGAFALTRKSVATALAGVAIAVALVPPLCVLGIGLALGSEATMSMGLTLGDRAIVPGSFLLFATNLVGIIVSAGLVFLFQAYGSFKQAVGGLIAAVFSMALVSYPLGFSFNRLLLRNEIYRELTDVQRQRPDLFKDVSSYSWNVRFFEGEAYVEMDLAAPPGLLNNSRLSLLRDAIAQELTTPVTFKFRLIPVTVVGMKTTAADQSQQP